MISSLLKHDPCFFRDYFPTETEALALRNSHTSTKAERLRRLIRCRITVLEGIADREWDHLKAWSTLRATRAELGQIQLDRNSPENALAREHRWTRFYARRDLQAVDRAIELARRPSRAGHAHGLAHEAAAIREVLDLFEPEDFGELANHAQE